MNKVLIFLLFLGILHTVASQITLSPELLVNGNFGINNCNNQFCITGANNFVKQWIPDPQLQIGEGSYYNKYLKKEKVLELAPNSNSCVKQVMKGLKAGTYILKFEYAARSDVESEDCMFAVKFNGRFLKSITPLDDRIRTQVVEVEVKTESEGVVQVCSTGEKNNKYGAILQSVSFALKTGKQVNPAPLAIPVKKPGQNIIINPHFQKNPCTTNFCHYNTDRPNIIQGWIPDTQIEVGYGSIYNRFLGDERVLDLAPTSNQCVRQVVRDLRPGLYDLSYEYAARTDFSLVESEFEVSWEGKVVRKISPLSDRLQKDTVTIEVAQQTEGVLKFCSLGPNNHQGGLLRSVFMTRKKLSDQPFDPISYTIYIDSHSNKCLQRQYNFTGEKTTISFKFNVLSNFAIRKTLSYVALDSVLVYQMHPCSSGKTLSFQYEVEKGMHKLGFCAEGSEEEPRHQIAISDIELDQKPVCVAGWGKDLVRNGGFQQNKCNPSANWCHYNRQNIERSVPGWMASPLIQIGKSAFYNKDAWAQLSLGYVSELDAAGNSCIKQRISQITKGKYQLRFDWAAKVGFPLDSSGVEVRINGQMISSYDAKSYDINRETIEFELKKNPSDPLLQFCGGGKNDHYGASVDNIQLIKFNQC